MIRRLKGMTWSHPRGYDPMVATAAAWAERTGIEISWDKRSLQDFESFPVEQLARNYDLIVIDHPHVGQITAEGCLAPLDVPQHAAAAAELSAGSVGQSYDSYRWDGRQWALPIDAAAQVQAYRPDRIEHPLETWDEVLTAARAGRVVIPLLPPHSLMLLYTLAANLGQPCATIGEQLIEPRSGAEVVARLSELTALLAPDNFELDPITASELLAGGDTEVAAMPYGYGYASYAMDGFRPHRLAFADIPAAGTLGPAGSVLGGTGIAVSAFSSHADAAIAYAYWIAGAEVQSGLYARSGGQPGHAAAWSDDAVNRATHDFYRNTRKTLETAWVRPRHDGYMRFQEAASQRLNAGLRNGETATGIVAALNQLYRETR